MTIAPEAPITGARLQELCDQKKVVKGDMHKPSPAAWARLAMFVNVLRNDAMDIDARQRRYSQILPEVQGETDRLLEERRRDASRATVNPLVDERGIERAIAAFEQLQAGIQAVRSHVFFPGHEPIGMRPNRKGSKWPSYTGILATIFVEAMEETNPGVAIGLGDDGPVARFIAAVIPFITGENPKPAAIARCLQRAQAH